MLIVKGLVQNYWAQQLGCSEENAFCTLEAVSCVLFVHIIRCAG